MRRSSRSALAIGATVLFLLVPGTAAAAADPAITADRAAVYDPLTDEYLYSKAGTPVAAGMASTAKIMTIYVALDAVAQGKTKLSDRITFSVNAAATLCNCFNDVDNTIEAGDEMTLRDALYAVSLSDGEPTVAVAEHVAAAVLGEDHEDVVEDPVMAFVGLMNDTAGSLGLGDTHFETPHGGDHPDQVMSAKDLARLWAAGATNHAEFLTFLGWWSRNLVVFHDGGVFGTNYYWSNSHGYYPGVEGSKGGNSGSPAGMCPQCWVASAQRLTRRLVVSDMQSDANIADAVELFRWGFDDLFQPKRVGDSGDLDKVVDHSMDCSGGDVVSALRTPANKLTLRRYTVNADAGSVTSVSGAVTTLDAVEADIARVTSSIVATVHRKPDSTVELRTWRWAAGNPALVDTKGLAGGDIVRVIKLNNTRVMVARRTAYGIRLETWHVSQSGLLVFEDMLEHTGLVQELDIASNVSGQEVMAVVRRDDGKLVLRTFSVANDGQIAIVDEDVRGDAKSVRVAYVGSGFTGDIGDSDEWNERWTTSYVRSDGKLGLAFWRTNVGVIALAGTWGDAGQPAAETSVAGALGTGAVSAYQLADGKLAVDVADYDWTHPGPATWSHYRVADSSASAAGAATQVEVCQVPTSKTTMAQVTGVRTSLGVLKFVVWREASKQ